MAPDVNCSACRSCLLYFWHTFVTVENLYLFVSKSAMLLKQHDCGTEVLLFFVSKKENKATLVHSEESRTPKKSQSESTRLSDFFIIAWLEFTKLVHCCILFIKKCLCYAFPKLSSKHTKLKLENHSSVSILTAFFWCSRLYQCARNFTSKGGCQHLDVKLWTHVTYKPGLPPYDVMQGA